MRACRPQLPSFRQNRPHSPASVLAPLPVSPSSYLLLLHLPLQKKQDLVLNIRGKLKRGESLSRCPLHIKKNKKERTSSLKCMPREGRMPGSLLEKGPSKETYCLHGSCSIERNMPQAVQPLCLRRGSLEEATGGLATGL